MSCHLFIDITLAHLEVGPSSFFPTFHQRKLASFCFGIVVMSDPDLVGTLVAERFRIIRRIGGGSFGEIYMGIGPNLTEVRNVGDTHSTFFFAS